jgi:hypothetical protein
MNATKLFDLMHLIGEFHFALDVPHGLDPPPDLDPATFGGISGILSRVAIGICRDL